jgi:hypothetical protein
MVTSGCSWYGQCPYWEPGCDWVSRGRPKKLRTVQSKWKLHDIANRAVNIVRRLLNDWLTLSCVHGLKRWQQFSILCKQCNHRAIMIFMRSCSMKKLLNWFLSIIHTKTFKLIWQRVNMCPSYAGFNRQKVGIAGLPYVKSQKIGEKKNVWTRTIEFCSQIRGRPVTVMLVVRLKLVTSLLCSYVHVSSYTCRLRVVVCKTRQVG